MRKRFAVGAIGSVALVAGMAQATTAWAAEKTSCEFTTKITANPPSPYTFPADTPEIDQSKPVEFTASTTLAWKKTVDGTVDPTESDSASVYPPQYSWKATRNGAKLPGGGLGGTSMSYTLYPGTFVVTAKTAAEWADVDVPGTAPDWLAKKLEEGGCKPIRSVGTLEYEVDVEKPVESPSPTPTPSDSPSPSPSSTPTPSDSPTSTPSETCETGGEACDQAAGGWTQITVEQTLGNCDCVVRGAAPQYTGGTGPQYTG